MNQEPLPREGPGPGLCGSDREMFQRVWQRVMPEDRPDCPIRVLTEAEIAALEGGADLPALSPGAAVSALRPEGDPVMAVQPLLMPAAISKEQNGETGGQAEELGPASAVYGPLLQALIADELADWRTYRALAGRAGGRAARVLRGMADDERRHARRLSAAYFLISGVRYWPERGGARTGNALPSLLRERFAGEQRGKDTYLALARETEDSALQTLYEELAQDEASHMNLLRGLLENL